MIRRIGWCARLTIDLKWLSRMITLIVFIVMVPTLLIGCGSDSGSDDSDAAADVTAADATPRDLCIQANGVVDQRIDSDGNIIDVCIYDEIVTYDDGEQVLTHVCELETFYDGVCHDGDGSDINPPESVASGDDDVEQALEECLKGKTVRAKICKQVEDILTKIDNTGYTHRPFSLDPDVSGLSQTSITKYDLFTDCSGFVGYYVLQGIAKPLYDKLPRSYSCGPMEPENNSHTQPARPLAADFVDHIYNSEVFAGREPTNVKGACWSRVDHIKDALPGDVVAYLHPDNLDLDTKYCCYREGFVYKSEKVDDKQSCDKKGGRVIYKSKKDKNGKSKNTGHVLFVHGKPYRSNKKTDGKGTYQWVVEIADSTTSPHMDDSRFKGKDNSVYGSNHYHAWSKGDEGFVQRCTNGEYHRDCPTHNSYQQGGNIDINTGGDHATGIGIGKMYVSDNMRGYRTSYSHATENARVVIGRPIRCKK